MKQRILMLVLLGCALLALGGCNTVRGVGRDVERAGEVIQGRSAQLDPAPASAPVQAR